jgi:DUF971 family protein
MQIIPTRIDVNRELAQLKIDWKDGHISVYSFTLLRNACPCVECRGGHDKMGGAPDPEVFLLPLEDSARTRLAVVEAVGTYAINIYWEDGHQYGIYTWDFLRGICPCPLCRGV